MDTDINLAETDTDADTETETKTECFRAIFFTKVVQYISMGVIYVQREPGVRSHK